MQTDLRPAQSRDFDYCSPLYFTLMGRVIRELNLDGAAQRPEALKLRRMHPLEPTLQKPPLVAVKTSPKAKTIVYWIVTALFCLQMTFTAYAQLRLPVGAQAFTHLGFPAYLRGELSWAKFLGVVLLLAPVPARLKEWAYAGFASNLASALIAHVAVGDGPDAWGWAVGTGVLWGLSYFLWRRLEATPASA